MCLELDDCGGIQVGIVHVDEGYTWAENCRHKFFLHVLRFLKLQEIAKILQGLTITPASPYYAHENIWDF